MPGLGRAQRYKQRVVGVAACRRRTGLGGWVQAFSRPLSVLDRWPWSPPEFWSRVRTGSSAFIKPHFANCDCVYFPGRQLADKRSV
jgi:hypothetical protein